MKIATIKYERFLIVDNEPYIPFGGEPKSNTYYQYLVNEIKVPNDLVDIVGSNEEALRSIQKLNYDIVLTRINRFLFSDILIDGNEVLLHAKEKNRETRVFFATAGDKSYGESLITGEPPEEIITEPISWKKFLELLNQDQET